MGEHRDPGGERSDQNEQREAEHGGQDRRGKHRADRPRSGPVGNTDDSKRGRWLAKEDGNGR